MDLWNGLIAVGVFAAALWYLYRTIFKKGGCSCGSDSCCSKSPSGVKKPANDAGNENEDDL